MKRVVRFANNIGCSLNILLPIDITPEASAVEKVDMQVAVMVRYLTDDEKSTVSSDPSTN